MFVEFLVLLFFGGVTGVGVGGVTGLGLGGSGVGVTGFLGPL